MEFKSLSFFIQRAKVLALYRRTLRSIGKLRGTMRSSEVEEMRAEVRREYRRHRHLENSMDIRSCMLNAERQAKFLESGAVTHAAIDSVSTKDNREMETQAQEQDKWISSSEFHDESDVLGRVGSGWPWGAKS